MEDYAYISLSDAYTTYQVCSYIFNKETPPTNEDVGFAMDSFDRIYKDIGIVYSHIVSDLNVFNKIQSLGGRTRAKNMILIKVKFLENGRKVHFTVILGVREIFLANLI